MSTFVGKRSEDFRGRIRHVPTGEEARFSSVTDLLVFFEEMNAVSDLCEDDDTPSQRSRSIIQGGPDS